MPLPLLHRRDYCKHQINGEGTERVTIATKTLEGLVLDLDAGKEELRQKETEHARVCMAKIANRISTLDQIKKDICSNQGGGASVGAAILSEAINGLMKEGEEIGKTCGGWSDFIATLNISNERYTSSLMMSNEDKDSDNTGDHNSGASNIRKDGCEDVNGDANRDQTRNCPRRDSDSVTEQEERHINGDGDGDQLNGN